MSAQIVRLGASVAERYANCMAVGVREECREQAFAEWLDFAQRLAANGFTHADVDNMIALKRARLIRELAEINRL